LALRHRVRKRIFVLFNATISPSSRIKCDIEVRQFHLQVARRFKHTVFSNHAEQCFTGTAQSRRDLHQQEGMRHSIFQRLASSGVLAVVAIEFNACVMSLRELLVYYYYYFYYSDFAAWFRQSLLVDKRQENFWREMFNRIKHQTRTYAGALLASSRV
jgi:hypothetical protein